MPGHYESMQYLFLHTSQRWDWRTTGADSMDQRSSSARLRLSRYIRLKLSCPIDYRHQ